MFQKLILPHTKNLTSSLTQMIKRNLAKESKKVEHIVLVSQSTDIYDNLALEDWIFEKEDLKEKSILLLWRNKPSVVFGRHQVPWLECDVPGCRSEGVSIVRRKSGGGAVFHDEGNLNCSFICDRSRYLRKENLDLIVDALTGRWDLPLMVNNRFDILLDKMYKISGTAAKLAGNKSYHHFTLLYDVDTSRLHSLLQSPLVQVETKATQSIVSHVKNMKEYAQDMNFETLVQVVAERFFRKNKQKHKHLRTVDPLNEAKFPGVGAISRSLREWDWIYGKSPKFSIKRKFVSSSNSVESKCDIDIHTDKGKIVDCHIVVTAGTECLYKFAGQLSEKLENKKLETTELISCLTELSNSCSCKYSAGLETNSCDWLINCIKNSLPV
ncbi:hypothetical protein ScPMuIL_007947 [Solemya velum]